MDIQQLRIYLSSEIERQKTERDMFIAKMNMELGRRNGDIEAQERILGLLEIPLFDLGIPNANASDEAASMLADNFRELDRFHANGQAIDED